MSEPQPSISTVALRSATLTDLPPDVIRPVYDRAVLSPGIVHIGLGNFHRAHQAWYLHRLMQQGLAQDWAIIGAGVRPYDAQMRDRLLAQDCLTTLIELDPKGTSAEVTGPMIDYLPIIPGNAPLIDQLTDPAIRIVSLTVTEGGYYTDPVTGQLDQAHPDIQHDITTPTQPRTVFGAIVAGLRQRMARGAGPFTVMSCDNLRGNGDITRDAVIGLARLMDPALAEWISDQVTFPNAMVDCIVPATGPHEIALARDFGIDDAAPVTHENFRQWVVEDKFCAGRPPLEKVGVTLTDDVHAYESMKIRILNAGHQVLANVGELLGQATISECMSHPLIGAFFRKVQVEEILPHVVAVPGMTPATYLDQIERRFGNVAIVDTVRRVAFDGSARHSGFVGPIIQDARKVGASTNGLALVEALWARMCAGLREDGSVIEANDPHWSDLQRAALDAKIRPQIWLSQNQYYAGLTDDPVFSRQFETWLRGLWTDGVASTVQAYVDG